MIVPSGSDSELAKCLDQMMREVLTMPTSLLLARYLIVHAPVQIHIRSETEAKYLKSGVRYGVITVVSFSFPCFNRSLYRCDDDDDNGSGLVVSPHTHTASAAPLVFTQ